MIVRLCNRLTAKIKEEDLKKTPLDENPYADWSARLFVADRTQYILLSHTRSLYSVVLYGAGITCDHLFIVRVLDNLREFMTDDKLGLIYMNYVAPTTTSVCFSKSLNRSIIGSMNELEATAKQFLKDGKQSPYDVGFQLNETPLSVIGNKESGGFETPRNAFKQIGMW